MPAVLNVISSPFDSYSRTARLAPGLLLLLGPVAVAIGAGVREWPAASALAAIVGAMGLPLALAEWVRRRGQQLQVGLWARWGGNPVVAALRDDGLIARKRRDALAAATGLPLAEANHPDFEEAATNAVRQLISATRDTSRYALVFAENKAYGFARNLLALRPIGVLLSSAAVVGGLALVAVSIRSQVLSTRGTTLGVAVAAVAVAFWLFYPSEERVRAAAHDYRDRLLEALDARALTSQGIPPRS